MNSTANQDAERRRQERVQWLRFESQVRVRRSLFRKEWVSVVPFDFSRFGMGIQTDEQFDVGDQVCLSLTLCRESAGISIPELQGLVRYKEKHHSRFNYGVEFVFRDAIERYALEEQLIRIEVALRKFVGERCRDQNLQLMLR